MLSHTRRKNSIESQSAFCTHYAVCSPHFLPGLYSVCTRSAVCSLQSAFSTNGYLWHQYSLFLVTVICTTHNLPQNTRVFWLISLLRLDQRIFEIYLPVVVWNFRLVPFDHRLYERDIPLVNFYVRFSEHHDVTRLHFSFVWIRKFYTFTSGKIGRVSVLRKKDVVSSFSSSSERLEE